MLCTHHLFCLLTHNDEDMPERGRGHTGGCTEVSGRGQHGCGIGCGGRGRGRGRYGRGRAACSMTQGDTSTSQAARDTESSEESWTEQDAAPQQFNFEATLA